MTTDASRETDEQKVARLRELLPATSAGIYLDTATFGPLPAETAAAMREADDWELKVGRATVGRDEDMEQRVEEARAVIAALLVADPSEIVLTPGVDAAAALVGRISNSRETSVLDASLMVGAAPLEAVVRGRRLHLLRVRQVVARSRADGRTVDQSACSVVGRRSGSVVWTWPDGCSRAGAQRRLDRDVCGARLGVRAHKEARLGAP